MNSIKKVNGFRSLLHRNCLVRSYYASSSLLSTSSQQPTPVSSSKSLEYVKLGRFDKPIGTWLLLWPCCWSTALAAPLGSLPDGILFMQFAVGALAMRGAGCTINDMWDRDFDKHVERTKTRPLASGKLNLTNAVGFLSAQLGVGLLVLLSLNPTTQLLGLASMPLVVAYPLMKRYTNWPQAVLGLTFNWGALIGYTAVTGLFIPNLHHTLPLYFSGVCWTLVYDTIYAYQDRNDDKKLQLKSTALTLGDKPQIPLTGFATAMVGGLALAGFSSDLTYPFYVGVSGVYAHLLWQIWTSDIDNPQNLWIRFSSNQYTGAAVTAAIVAGHF